MRLCRSEPLFVLKYGNQGSHEDRTNDHNCPTVHMKPLALKSFFSSIDFFTALSNTVLLIKT